MRIEQLEYISTVIQCGSLRRAGEQLHISQPALSESISRLERELGVVLLERHRTGSRISADGRRLLDPIIEVLDSVQRLRGAAGRATITGRPIRLGTVNAGTASLLLPAMRAFQDEHPGSIIEIRNLLPEQVQLAVVDGALDLGLVNLIDGDDLAPGLAEMTLLSGQPTAVLPADHQLASRSEITPDDLRGERFVAMRPGYLMHRLAHRLFQGDLPATWSATDGAEMAKLMVAERIGLTILPDYSVAGDPLERAGLIVTRPLRTVPTAVRMACVWRPRTPIPTEVQNLLRHLLAAAHRDRKLPTQSG